MALQDALDASPTPAQAARAHYHLGAASVALRTYGEAISELAMAAAADDPALATKARDLLGDVVRDHLDAPQLDALSHRFPAVYPGDLILAQLAQRHRSAGNVPSEVDARRRLADAFAEHPGAATTLERLQTLEAMLDTDPTRLGVLLPLSGPTGQIGRSALQSVQLALDMLQRRHADLDLSLVIRDTGASTETARSALRALAEEAHVIGVIGPLLSQTAEKLAPLAGKLGVPLISPFARDSQFPQLSRYAFRNSLTDAMQGRLLASYATQRLGRRRFAILYPDDAYGAALADHFSAALADHNGRVVVKSRLPTRRPRRPPRRAAYPHRGRMMPCWCRTTPTTSHASPRSWPMMLKPGSSCWEPTAGTIRRSRPSRRGWWMGRYSWTASTRIRRCRTWRRS